MSYFKPYVDETGLHYPTYNEILEAMVEDAQGIYGSGIYLGTDSPDYQFMSSLAEKIYDSYQSIEIAYNAHSPVTAIGTGLDYIVAINGIARKVSTSSTATLTITGTAGTTIEDGQVSDDNGNLWDLPEIVIIGDNGVVDVEAICQQTGVITAAANTITNIMTPTQGWESVTNANAAVTGSATETDSELRARQAYSVAQPSQSVLKGLKGALASLENVQRVEVYENDTGATDANGVPAHSICAVVEGGDSADIAETIWKRKSPGCGTYGGVSQVITDDDEQSYTIGFSRVQYVDIDIQINITTRGGYSATTPSEIKSALVEFLDNFSIGTDLTTSIIWMVAQQINTDPRTPSFSISSVKAARHGGALGVLDVAIDYDEVAHGNAAYITVNVS